MSPGYQVGKYICSTSIIPPISMFIEGTWQQATSRHHSYSSKTAVFLAFPIYLQFPISTIISLAVVRFFFRVGAFVVAETCIGRILPTPTPERDRYLHTSKAELLVRASQPDPSRPVLIVRTVYRPDFRPAAEWPLRRTAQATVIHTRSPIAACSPCKHRLFLSEGSCAGQAGALLFSASVMRFLRVSQSFPPLGLSPARPRLHLPSSSHHLKSCKSWCLRFSHRGTSGHPTIWDTCRGDVSPPRASLHSGLLEC
ncbi:hypothetical protein F5Y17DRAFT_345889 [Xylariaceae sp. FL0594]|nr:hypothetical protein F5Y17DRAFT_345889 [Xylariaceae sp. FL0594]